MKKASGLLSKIGMATAGLGLVASLASPARAVDYDVLDIASYKGPGQTVEYNKRNAEDCIPVDNFGDFVGGGFGHDIEMVISDDLSYIDNLAERDVDGVPTVIQGRWLMGFAQYLGQGSVQIVGYAENQDRNFEGAEGYMRGRLYEIVGEGNRPDEVLTVHDVDGDGLGCQEVATGAMRWDEDDFRYTLNDMLVGKVDPFTYEIEELRRGDNCDLPWFSSGGHCIRHCKIPHMEVNPSPAALYVCGDFNNDGRVSASDALADLIEAVGGTSNIDCNSCSDEAYVCGDVNDDGAVLASDALQVLRHSVGIAGAELSCGECSSVEMGPYICE